mmetsp:Transcript_12220/g.17612  ORF Transcript_12220/g.17612 Transcript_12220/m.17612 type:complete len:125 (+) Transcript_12220:314-688(+)
MSVRFRQRQLFDLLVRQYLDLLWQKRELPKVLESSTIQCCQLLLDSRWKKPLYDECDICDVVDANWCFFPNCSAIAFRADSKVKCPVSFETTLSSARDASSKSTSFCSTRWSKGLCCASMPFMR